MKMGIGLFWGVILIAIGLSIIFKVVFGISIFRIIIAVVFIMIGIKILMGRSAININAKDSDVIFNERKYTEFPLTSTEYNTIFGNTVYDFGKASVSKDSTVSLKFNAVFGHTEIFLPADLPVKIKGTGVFGSVKLPNKNTAVFGDANYSSVSDSVQSNFVSIEANAVFGNIEINQSN